MEDDTAMAHCGARAHRARRRGLRRRRAGAPGRLRPRRRTDRCAADRQERLGDRLRQAQRAAVRVPVRRPAPRRDPPGRRAQAHLAGRRRRVAVRPRAGARRRGRQAAARLPDPDPGLARNRQRHARRAADRRHLLPALQLVARLRPPSRWPRADLRDDREPAQVRPRHVGPPDRVVVAAAERRGRRRRAHRNAPAGASIADAQLGRLQTHPPKRRRALTRHRRRARLRRQSLRGLRPAQLGAVPVRGRDGRPPAAQGARPGHLRQTRDRGRAVRPARARTRRPDRSRRAPRRGLLQARRRIAARRTEHRRLARRRHSRCVDPRLGGRALSFERRGDAFVDRQTGSRWNIAGRAVAGELAGERLAPVRHDQQFWFALAAFVPHARIER
ncbi:MAG: DUF3179 domain-containing protein [Thermoleophilaceae bacterium]|nr:DUF3179 domain-containing protein [Thermoleophilaceae bacterium]